MIYLVEYVHENSDILYVFSYDVGKNFQPIVNTLREKFALYVSSEGNITFNRDFRDDLSKSLKLQV